MKRSPPVPQISLDFIPTGRKPTRSNSLVRLASAPPLSGDQPHHDVSRTDTAEDLEGDRFDQIEVHIRHILSQLETNLEERIDFRNAEIIKDKIDNTPTQQRTSRLYKSSYTP